MPNGNGSPKGNPEGLGEMMKRVLHAVQLAVPIGIITRPNTAQRSKLGSALVGTRFGCLAKCKSQRLLKGKKLYAF
jgi:hypothetical protein